jgi:pimeloyl-ACP methyl ester carboxylesterase
MVSDLRRLLARAGVAPPYLLVGHSFGGLDMRLFAGEHPGEVAGLVLLDATPTTLLDDACAISRSLCDMYVGSWAWRSNPEGVQFERSAHQVDARTLPRIPLVVMTATNHRDPGLSARINRRVEAKWQRAQRRVAASVPGGRLVVVKGEHDIQDEHPRAVVAAIAAELKQAG